MVPTGLSKSKRDFDQPWYGLMQELGDGTCPPERGIAEATRCLETTGDGCWGLPLALAYWVQKKYKETISPTDKIKNNGGHTEDYLKRQRESWGNKDV